MLIIYIVLAYLGVCSSKPVQFQFTINRDTKHVKTLGKKATIDCETDSANAWVTLWKVDGKKMTKVQEGPNLEEDDDEFVIKNLLSNDAGKYMCEAIDRSSGQRITRFVTIEIDSSQPALEISPSQHNITVFTKATIRLVCEGVTTINGSIKWEFKHLKQGVPLLPSQHSITKTTVNGFIQRHVLVIPNAATGFSGTYRCKLTNYVSLNHYITKTEDIAINVGDPQPPAFYNPNPETFKVGHGKHLVLHCEARADVFPKPDIHWERDGNMLSTCRKIYRHPCTGAPYLKVSDGINITSAVYPRDDGTYTCTAKNQFGSATKTFHVVVEEKPVLNRFPGSVVRFDPTKSYSITCTATAGNPPPKFTWKMRLFFEFYSRRGGTVHRSPIGPWMSNLVSMGHTVTISQDKMSSTVTIPLRISSAYYKCKATNAAGRASHLIIFRSKLTKY